MPNASRSILLLAALSLASAGAPVLASQSATLLLTEDSSFAKVDPGQAVEIRLKTQGGTGYSWRPTTYLSKIKELSTRQSAMPGGKEVQRFKFKSKKKGTYVVGFTYGQPWKGGTKGAKYRSFTIKVR